MDDLRTRIAAVIRREVPCHPPGADRIADVLIRELGLTQERRHPVANEAGMRVGTWTMPTESRYVTEWVADE